MNVIGVFSISSYGLKNFEEWKLIFGTLPLLLDAITSSFSSIYYILINLRIKITG